MFTASDNKACQEEVRRWRKNQAYSTPQPIHLSFWMAICADDVKRAPYREVLSVLRIEEYRAAWFSSASQWFYKRNVFLLVAMNSSRYTEPKNIISTLLFCQTSITMRYELLGKFFIRPANDIVTDARCYVVPLCRIPSK